MIISYASLFNHWGRTDPSKTAHLHRSWSEGMDGGTGNESKPSIPEAARNLQRVPSDQHRAWPLRLVEAEKEVGETNDGAATSVALSPDSFRQRVVRAVRERVTVGG